ncbi:restriction endonuclease [uncultured Nostoc sp.]|uniref:restriction endonuclease n=1 Tax=uncultured Nostoc sp. TaxID=340711 RepID=UPI0035CA707F
MLENQTDWRKYEEYTRAILNDERVKKYLEEHFNLPDLKIQSKEYFSGKSGTEWQVDAYGYDENDLILIECKHYKNEARVEQNIIAAFAYIIKDVRAKYGIIVTTSGLQSGAKKVADAENIRLIEVHQNSTDKNFFIRFPEHHQSVAVFTDKIEGVGSGCAISQIPIHIQRYPLEEARHKLIQKSLSQGINRTDFSYEEILEEAKKMMAEG